MSVAEPLSAPIRVGPESNGMSMTSEEFDAITEWNEHYRYELIRGVLVVSPPAGAGERGPNDLLGHLIWYYQQNHTNGRDRRRDYKEKRLEYARIGIKEYWVIDRFDCTMTVFRGSRSVTVVEEHKTYRTKLLPGFELPLQPTLESADGYADDD